MTKFPFQIGLALLLPSLLAGCADEQAKAIGVQDIDQAAAAADAAGPAGEGDPFAGIWTGRLEGIGRAVIEPRDAGQGAGAYSVDLIVDEPTSGCSGGIEGPAKVEGGALVLETDELGQTCRITMTPEGGSLIVGEAGCMAWHGMSCGFSGTLERE